MPSTRDIARARVRFSRADLFPDRATIQRPVVVADGGGGSDTTYPTLAADVPCRLAPIGGGEDDGGSAGERISADATAVVTFAAGRDVAESDRIVIDGQTFDVQLVRRRGQLEITRRVEVRELVV